MSGGEPLVVAYVEWIDSAIAATSWESEADVLEAARRLLASPIRTAGILLERSEDRVVVAASVNPNADDAMLVIAIPAENVRRLDVWIPPVAVIDAGGSDPASERSDRSASGSWPASGAAGPSPSGASTSIG